MFEQAFKNIDDTLRKEAGCTTDLNCTKRTSWLLFLKYLSRREYPITLGRIEGRALPLCAMY
jgi:type I restriction enzyme M protein